MKSAIAEVAALFEDILHQGTDLRVTVTGRSMRPFLQGGETVLVRQASRRSYRRGDLVFFINRHGAPVLHRLLKVNRYHTGEFGFQTRGDALKTLDDPVNADRCLGKVCQIEKNVAGRPLEVVDLETGRWRLINFLLALFYLLESGLYSVWAKLKRRA